MMDDASRKRIESKETIRPGSNMDNREFFLSNFCKNFSKTLYFGFIRKLKEVCGGCGSLKCRISKNGMISKQWHLRMFSEISSKRLSRVRIWNLRNTGNLATIYKLSSSIPPFRPNVYYVISIGNYVEVVLYN
jgi:hypothetical protein